MHNWFHYLTNDTKQRDWPVICWVRFRILWYFPLSWKTVIPETNVKKVKVSSAVHTFRTLAEILSSPVISDKWLYLVSVSRAVWKLASAKTWRYLAWLQFPFQGLGLSSAAAEGNLHFFSKEFAEDFWPVLGSDTHSNVFLNYRDVVLARPLS